MYYNKSGFFLLAAVFAFGIFFCGKCRKCKKGGSGIERHDTLPMHRVHDKFS